MSIQKSRPDAVNADAAKASVKRILIVDDHPAVREGLAARIAIEVDLEICGQAADIKSGLDLVETTNPDAMVVDISLQTGNGLDLIQRLKARGNAIPILVWSMYDEELYADRALRAGAMGYITKTSMTDTIIKAIRKILAGKVFLSERMSERFLHRVVIGQTGVQSNPIESLSDRELQTFQLIGHGFTTKEVATRMSVSTATIETYRTRIKAKLEITTAAELIREAAHWVLENG